MPSLRELRWTNYPGDDLSAVASSNTLRKVQLDGVRRLRRFLPEGVTSQSITDLDLAYGRGQVQVQGLRNFAVLQALALHAVRLDDCSEVGRLIHLRSLQLVSCGEVPNLEWVRQLGSLAHVAVHDTRVLNAELSPLDDLPSLLTRYVQPRREYNRAYTDSVTADDAAQAEAN